MRIKEINYNKRKVYFKRLEAAQYLSISVDVFDQLNIPFIEIKRGLKRYCIYDLDYFMQDRRIENNSNSEEGEVNKQKCSYIKEKETQTITSHGMKKESVLDDLRELHSGTKLKH